MKFSTLTILGAVSLAAAHKHAHRHHARHGSPVEVRDAAIVETVNAPEVTVYELNGKQLSPADVEAGLKDGKYVLVGEKISGIKSSTSSTTKKAAPTNDQAAKFFEKPKPSTTSTTKPAPTTTSQAPPPPPPTTTSAAPSTPSGGGLTSDFVSGTIPCSQFPSGYGPIPVDWLNHGGWTGIQNVPGFQFGVDGSISYIQGGAGCSKNSFCSYACPPGYQKAQWPQAQGSTGQSIGGLWCNNDGFLELSSTSTKKLCIPGVGGVKVVNKLSQNAAICRTDYPGDESETIPLDTQPGGEYELCNPDQTTYYQWQGTHTSAQYYINNAGVPVNEACQWGVAGSNMGNWAPVNCGVGRGLDGVTYISLLPNAPTNPDGKLNFNIIIKGDVSGTCEYRNGNYYNNGVIDIKGCTVGVPSGGSAYYEFY